ncbi:cytochrome c-type biogenesis protein CcmH [Pelagibacterales bacterium SAG-MED38]|nr:cytochrome c-type biogenesis protein CcmH [Pelagibacterales bacterium SAG-MED38]
MRFVYISLIVSIILNFNFLKADEIKTENKIAKNLRCLICQGQSVYDSDSEFAISLKLLIKNKIQEGMSEDQIYGFLKTKYGEWILYDPVFNRNTYFLWLLPILIFLAGGAIIIKKFYNKNNLD